MAAVSEQSAILGGLRVLDFSRFVAGPYCASLLGALGAEVIRIEKVSGGEDRFLCSPVEGREGSLYLQCNQNKLCLTLDLAQKSGRTIADRLVESADIVVTSLPDGALRQLSLDYKSLCAHNSKIVATNVSTFGRLGPNAHKVGFDGVVQAMCGSTYMTGFGEQPTKSYTPWVDFGTAVTGAFGTLAAIIRRGQTGEGQEVDVSLLSTGLLFSHFYNLEQHMAGIERQRSGNRSQICGPSDLFKTADGWVMVQVIGGRQFAKWAKLVGAEKLTKDPDFRSDAGRGRHGHELSVRTQSWCESKTSGEVLDAFEKAKIPAAELFSPQDIFSRVDVFDSDVFRPMSFPGIEQVLPLVAPVLGLSQTGDIAWRRPPGLGEHTDDILKSLNYSKDQIRELRANGVV